MERNASRIQREIKVHADYYAAFQKKHGKRAFTPWIRALVATQTPGSFFLQCHHRYPLRVFLGWQPECGSKGMCRTTFTFTQAEWDNIDQVFQGQFWIWVNEMLEDDYLHPSRLAKKRAYWDGGGVKPPKPEKPEKATIISECSECPIWEKEYFTLASQYVQMHESAMRVIREYQKLLIGNPFPDSETVMHINGIENACQTVNPLRTKLKKRVDNLSQTDVR